jgi:hypothetical protein
MKRRLIILTIMCALLGVNLACSISSLNLTGAKLEENSLLFQDDFSSPNSGWATENDQSIKMGYSDDGFRMVIDLSNMDAWSIPGLSFSDVRIDVSAKKIGGPDDNDYGIICRYQDSDNFYSFIISSDGYFGINKRVNGQNSLLGDTQMEYSPAILSGDGENHLQADCNGNNLVLTVNDVQLIEVEDATFSKGDTGLIVGTFDLAGVDILFDDFRVMNLKAE